MLAPGPPFHVKHAAAATPRDLRVSRETRGRLDIQARPPASRLHRANADQVIRTHQARGYESRIQTAGTTFCADHTDPDPRRRVVWHRRPPVTSRCVPPRNAPTSSTHSADHRTDPDPSPERDPSSTTAASSLRDVAGRCADTTATPHSLSHRPCLSPTSGPSSTTTPSPIHACLDGTLPHHGHTTQTPTPTLIVAGEWPVIGDRRLTAPRVPRSECALTTARPRGGPHRPMVGVTPAEPPHQCRRLAWRCGTSPPADDRRAEPCLRWPDRLRRTPTSERAGHHRSVRDSTNRSPSSGWARPGPSKSSAVTRAEIPGRRRW